MIPNSTPQTTTTTKYCLLADDDYVVLNILKLNLQRFIPQGVEIITASNGDEALRVARDIYEKGNEIALVISDFNMQPMNGSVLLRFLDDFMPETKKVLLTGQADIKELAELLGEIQLFRYLEKPWNPKDLELTVLEAIKSFDAERLVSRKSKELEQINAQLEQMIEERTNELSQKIQEIGEGLQYARYIQESFLPELNELYDTFRHIHVFTQSVDHVSGDFYWYNAVGDESYFVLGDCTGHGLAGSMLTILTNSILMEAFMTGGDLPHPKVLVEKTMSELQRKINRNGHSNPLNVGADLGVVRINRVTKKMVWASLNSTILVYDEAANTTEVLAHSHGFIHTQNIASSITEGEANIEGKKIVLLTDGLLDQFGGEKKRRLKLKGLLEFIETGRIFHGDVCMIEHCFNIWKDREKLIDDSSWISVAI